MEKLIEKTAQKLDRDNEISQWTIRGLKAKEHQFFATALSAEEQRIVLSENIVVDLYHIRGRHQGFSTFTIAPHEIDHVDEKIARALMFCKKLINNRLFFLPAPHRCSPVALLDPRLQRDPVGSITSVWNRIKNCFSKSCCCRLSTAEIFASSAEHFMRNSRGFNGHFSSSSLFLDFVITAGNSEEEAESHGEYRIRSIDSLPLEEIVECHSRYALDKLGASLPPSGDYPVIMSRESLIPLFEPFMYHASGKAFDMGISQLRKGKPVYRGDRLEGDGLTLVSDPRLPMGIRSFPYDGQGVPSRRVTIIKDSIFKNIWATKEYADYLGIEPTGEPGNLLLQCGARSEQDFFDEKRLLDVAEFSYMHPDQASGNFVDEIRLAYLVENGKRRPIRGGSISGNVFTAFGKAFLSSESYQSGHYCGPRAAKFLNLSISGS